MIQEAGVGGNLTTNAHWAAWALEHDATRYSRDTDVSRFSRIKWVNPLSEGTQSLLQDSRIFLVPP
jgi:hypothetical protein